MTNKVSRLLLCAAGGYQAYALPGFVLSLLKHVADDVRVVLSRAASKMVAPYAVEVATRHHVFIGMDEIADDMYVPHIELSRNADLILVYPATVNILGKVAQGIADELISAVILAAECPVFFVPVTNPAMWAHPAVQRNVAQLQKDGYAVLPPLPNIEIATREGLAEAPDPFPLPALAVQIAAALREGSTAARARRS